MTNIGTLKGTLKLDDKFSGVLGKNVDGMKALTAAGGVLAAGVAVVGATMIKAAADAFAFADAIDNQAVATNTGAEALQVFNVAAERAGQSSGSITTGIQRLQRSLVESTKETDEAFGRLNVNVDELRRLKPEDQFRVILQRLGDLPDPTERAATAMTLLGRSGANLQGLMGDSLVQLEEQMRSLGLVIDDDVIKKVDATEAEMDLLKRAAGGLWANFGNGIASSEGLSFTITFLQEKVGALSVWVQRNREEIAQWVNAGILVAASGIEFTLQFVGAFVAGLGILGGTVDRTALSFFNWFKGLLESPLAKFLPGVQGMREAVLKVTEATIAAIEKDLEWSEGIEKTGQGIFNMSTSVADFKENLLTQIETQAAATETQDAYAFSMGEVNAKVDAANEKTAQLNQMYQTMKRSLDDNRASAEVWKETMTLSVEELAGDVVPQAVESFNLLEGSVGGLESATSAAFRRMGLKTRAELQAMAAQAVRDYDTIVASGTATEMQLQAANKRKNDAIKEQEGLVNEFRVSGLQTSLAGSSQILGAFGAKNKAMAIAKAGIDTVLAVQRTFAQLGWPAGIPGMAIAAAMGAINVAKIAAQPAGFQFGTPDLDFMGFGAATTTILHGDEAIIPRGRGHELGQEVAAGILPALGELVSGSQPRGGGEGNRIIIENRIFLDGVEIKEWIEESSIDGSLRFQESSVRRIR